MIQYFDTFNTYEIPTIELHSINMQPIDTIGYAKNMQYKGRFNAMSEFSFETPSLDDNGNPLSYYDKLKYRKMIYAGEELGYFIISGIKEKNDGVTKKKYVSCKSLEFELTFPRIFQRDGSAIFYDILRPHSTDTIVGYIESKIPDWTFEYIDPALGNNDVKISRYDNSKNMTLYAWMVNVVQKKYECMFIFNRNERKISVYSLLNAVTDSSIYLSYDNLLKNVELTDIPDEIVTALTVYGKGDLSINQVNPLGGNTIYNFDYYKTTEWMSQSLIDAINSWEDKIEQSQGDYQEAMNAWTVANQAKFEAINAPVVGTGWDDDPQYDQIDEWGRVALENELTSLENLKSLRAESGQSADDINEAEEIVNSYLTAINTVIANYETEMSAQLDILTSINEDVSMTNPENFLSYHQRELSRFIMGNTYKNENFLQTDIMTPEEVSDMAYALYEQAQGVLEKVSQPVVQFACDSTNFIFLHEFLPFTKQLELGTQVHIDFDNGYTVYVVLLGIDINYDDARDFKLIFSNRLRLDDGQMQFIDLYEQIDRAVTETSFNSDEWATWSDVSNDVTNFINSALDASKNEVISSVNQEVTFGSYGLRGRKKLNDNTYSPEEIWLTSNTLAFTDDNWETAKTAIGKIQFVDPVSGTTGVAYGIVGQYLVGNVIIGNNLAIQNGSKTFTVNNDGVKLKNADLIITADNGATILMNSTNGIEISRMNNGVKEYPLQIDTTGNLKVRGDITATSGIFTGTLNSNTGNIGGWIINSAGLQSPNTVGGLTQFIKSNGDVTLGTSASNLKITRDGAVFNGTVYANAGSFTGTVNATSGVFSGEVRASKLTGAVDWNQITNAPNSNFPTYFNGGSGYSFGGFGSLSPTQIANGRWNFGAGTIGLNMGGDGGSLQFQGNSLVRANGGILALQSDSLLQLLGGKIMMSARPYVDTDTVSNYLLRQTDGDDRYSRTYHNHDDTYMKKGTFIYPTGIRPSIGYYSTNGEPGAGNGAPYTLRTASGGTLTIAVRNGIVTYIG